MIKHLCSLCSLKEHLPPPKKPTTTKQTKPQMCPLKTSRIYGSSTSKTRSPTMKCCLGLLSMEEGSQLFNYYVLLQHLLPIFPRRKATGQENHLVAHVQLQLDCLR